MESILLLCAVVIVICIVASRLSQRLGVPALLLFLALGMLFGSDGLFRIPFDNFEAAERICSVALIFIMFYGGFGTRWAARPAAARAVVLSTLGVAVTALLTALFCHLALGFSALESFLTGAVISSTDAASVFSILRSKKLGLRNHTASPAGGGERQQRPGLLYADGDRPLPDGGGRRRGNPVDDFCAGRLWTGPWGGGGRAVHSGAPQAHALRRAGYYFRGGCGPALLCPARRGGGTATWGPIWRAS